MPPNQSKPESAGEQIDERIIINEVIEQEGNKTLTDFEPGLVIKDRQPNDGQKKVPISGLVGKYYGNQAQNILDDMEISPQKRTYTQDEYRQFEN